MFLPIGDTPNPRGTPWINYILIGINVAVFVLVSLPLMAARPDLNDPALIEFLRALGAQGPIPAFAVLDQVSAYDLFVFKHGYRPADPSLLSLFSAMFLHAGWMHIGGNMLFLWIFGDNVEHRLGRINYLLVYLATGVAATLFFALFVPGSHTPLIGASGAISGVLGLYYFWFPRNKVRTFVFLFPFIMNTFYIPARWVLGFYLVVDNILPFLFTAGSGSGVAHGAHIGGFVGGLGLAYSIDRLPQWQSRSRLRRQAAGQAEPEAEELSVAERIARNVNMGSPARAAADYLGIRGREHRLGVAASDLLAIGEFLLKHGDHSGALTLFRNFIAERPTSPLLDRAYLGAGKSMIHQHRSITAAYQYFLSAIDVAQSEELAQEARLHLRGIERLGEKDGPHEH